MTNLVLKLKCLPVLLTGSLHVQISIRSQVGQCCPICEMAAMPPGTYVVTVVKDSSVQWQKMVIIITKLCGVISLFPTFAEYFFSLQATIARNAAYIIVTNKIGSR
jgi:hypothetical protein